MDTIVTEVRYVGLHNHTSELEEQVPQEEVYNDSNGVLLGAGPYMLLYSRRMTKDQIASFPVWPNYLTVCG